MERLCGLKATPLSARGRPGPRQSALPSAHQHLALCHVAACRWPRERCRCACRHQEVGGCAQAAPEESLPSPEATDRHPPHQTQLGSRERRRRKPYVRKACHLLRCEAEDFRGKVTEVAELRVTERHRLLAEAAQRLTMLLRKTAPLLSALALGPRKPTDKILRLCRRSARLGGLWDLWPRCVHDSRNSSLEAGEWKAATPPDVSP
jgi:hypothetical protein